MWYRDFWILLQSCTGRQTARQSIMQLLRRNKKFLVRCRFFGVFTSGTLPIKKKHHIYWEEIKFGSRQKEMIFNKKCCNRDLLLVTITKKKWSWRRILKIKINQTPRSWIGNTIRHKEFVVKTLEGAISGKKVVGRSRLQQLKQVARNTGADSYTAMKRMACNNSRWKAANQLKYCRI